MGTYISPNRKFEEEDVTPILPYSRDDRRWSSLLTRHVGQTETMKNSTVREFVNNDVWQDIKFLTNDHDLDETGEVYKMMFKIHSSVPEQYRRNVWNNVRVVINAMLKTKRNNTNNELQKRVFGKSNGNVGGFLDHLRLSQLNEPHFWNTVDNPKISPKKVRSNDSVVVNLIGYSNTI